MCWNGVHCYMHVCVHAQKSNLESPTYRERNNTYWDINLKNCRKAVSRYAKKWAKSVGVDRRVLRDWEEMVMEGIIERVSFLRQRHINKRKKHVLRNKVHLKYLKYLHDNFVPCRQSIR